MIDSSNTSNAPRAFGEATGGFHLRCHGTRFEGIGAQLPRRDMPDRSAGRHRPFGPDGRNIREQQQGVGADFLGEQG